MPAANGIFYAERGAGPPLLCVHGAGGTHRHWGGLLAGLAASARVIALDLPGHDRSAPPGRATLAAYAADLAALLDALGIERASVVGHSMGAAVALELAVAAPGRVVGLALVGAAARLRVAPALLDGLAAAPAPAIEQLVATMYPTAPQLRAPAAAEYMRWPATLRTDFLACDGWDMRARLPGLRLPALVLCGDADQLTPPKLARELQALLGAELAMLPGVGHVPMIEAPKATADALTGWLATQKS